MEEQKTLKIALGELAKILGDQAARHKVLREDMKVDFNLFTVVRRLGDEDGLHSRFLAHLLDPKADHCCGTLFLQPFMEKVKKLNWIDGPDLRKEDFSKVKVQRERGTDQGNLDIVIELHRQWIVVIENKVWAGEQQKQLERYGTYLKEWGMRNPGGKSLLVYLTLYGKEGESANGVHYAQMSYQKDVFDWLAQCLRETWAWPNINLALQQYQAVVAELTGQSLSQENIMELSEIFMKHPELIRDFGKIEAAKQEACKKARMHFFDLLACELRKEKYGYKVDSFPLQMGYELSKDELLLGGHQKMVVVFPHDYQNELWIGVQANSFTSEKHHDLHAKAVMMAKSDDVPIWSTQKKLKNGIPLCGGSPVLGMGDFSQEDFYPVMAGGSIEKQAQIVQKCVDRIDRWVTVIQKLWN